MSSIKRLDEVCVVLMGQAPSGDAYNTDGDGWPLLAGAGDFGESTPRPKKYTTQASKVSKVGDIILGIRASIGQKVISDGEYCLGRGVAALRPIGGLDVRYLWHWLTHITPELTAKARGATFKQVNRGDIGEIQISLPAPHRQQWIATKLDQAEELRAKRREAIAQLDKLAQSIFFEMFGDPATNPKAWPLVTIGAILQSANYGTSEKAGTEGDFPVLRMNNLTRSGEIDLSNLKYMNLPNTRHDRYVVQRGDVLFNRTNSPELVGKTAIYRAEDQVAYAGYLIRLRVNERADPEYLAAFLNTERSKTTLRGMCKSIIGMANINAKEVQGMLIPLTPLDLQQQFASRIGVIERLKVSHRAHLAELDTLFASLQHRAFRGEL